MAVFNNRPYADLSDEELIRRQAELAEIVGAGEADDEVMQTATALNLERLYRIKHNGMTIKRHSTPSYA